MTVWALPAGFHQLQQPWLKQRRMRKCNAPSVVSGGISSWMTGALSGRYILIGSARTEYAESTFVVGAELDEGSVLAGREGRPLGAGEDAGAGSILEAKRENESKSSTGQHCPLRGVLTIDDPVPSRIKLPLSHSGAFVGIPPSHEIGLPDLIDPLCATLLGPIRYIEFVGRRIAEV